MESVTAVLDNLQEDASQLANKFDELPGLLLGFGLNVLIALVIFIVGKILISLILKLINKIFERANVELSVRNFLKSLIRVVLYLVLVIVICAQVGIETASFITIIGSVGLAIGLALQGSLSNFAGGVLILILKPFKVGDYIKNSSSGEEGTVSKIDLFYTNLITADNILIIVPNGTLANSIIINSSAFEKRRMDISFGVNHDADFSKVKEIIHSMLMKNEKVIKEEEIIIFIKEFTQNQMTVEFRAWFMAVDFLPSKFAIYSELKQVLEENGLKVPYQQVEIHINNHTELSKKIEA